MYICELYGSTHECMFEGQRSTSSASWIILHFIFVTGSLTKSKAHLFSYAGWPMSSGGPLVSSHNLSAGVRDTTAVAWQFKWVLGIRTRGLEVVKQT